MSPRGRVLIIGGSGQVGGALMAAFGERNCIGTYTATKVEGMIPFDMEQAAMNPQLREQTTLTVLLARVRIGALASLCNSGPRAARCIQSHPFAHGHAASPKSR